MCIANSQSNIVDVSVWRVHQYSGAGSETRETSAVGTSKVLYFSWLLHMNYFLLSHVAFLFQANESNRLNDGHRLQLMHSCQVRSTVVSGVKDICAVLCQQFLCAKAEVTEAHFIFDK